MEIENLNEEIIDLEKDKSVYSVSRKSSDDETGSSKANYEYYYDEHSSFLKKKENEFLDENGKLNANHFEGMKKSDQELKKMKKKVVRNYYKHQSNLIANFLSLDQLHGEMSLEETKRQEKEAATKSFHIKLAINLSFILNIVLFIAKIYAAAASASLAFIASALDSFLDLLSGVIIFLTSYLKKKKNPYKYPAGKERLEPLGIIVFSACMFTATIQLLTTSIETLISKTDKIDLSIPTLVIIGFCIFSKLAIYIYCRTIPNSSVQALAQDHQNDVVSNGVGVAAALIAFYFVWWTDAVGAIIIGLYIMVNWFRTGYNYVQDLTGKSASPSFLQQLTYLAWNHDSRIIQIDTVRAFKLGIGYIVELDIVLPATMQLKEAHDIGESLQIKLEQISNVERAFVHLDYETGHKPEHSVEKKMELVDIDN